MKCPKECPCRWSQLMPLTAANRLEIEFNHFGVDGEIHGPEPEPSAAQGDVHWLDWHEDESR
jgi:hypothetical protein